MRDQTIENTYNILKNGDPSENSNGRELMKSSKCWFRRGSQDRNCIEKVDSHICIVSGVIEVKIRGRRGTTQAQSFSDAF